MNRFRTVLLAALAASLTLAAPGAAQSIPSAYRYIERAQEVGVFAGIMATNSGRFDLGPQDQTIVGARYSVEVSGPVALEGLASVAFGPRNVVNPNRLEGDRVIDEAEMRIILLEARLRFNLTGRRSWKRLQPYMFIGGGVGFDTLDEQDEDFALEESDRYTFGTRWTGNLGLGTRLMLGDRLHLRVDGGLRLYKVGIPTGWQDPLLGFASVPEDEWVAGQSITVGLGVRF